MPRSTPRWAVCEFFSFDLVEEAGWLRFLCLYFFAFIVVASCFIPFLSMGKRLFLSRALEGIPLHGDCGVGQNTHRAHCTLGTSHAGAHPTSELIACRGAIKHHGAIANYGATASEIMWRRKTLNWSRARGERKRRTARGAPYRTPPHRTAHRSANLSTHPPTS